tara:strand:+ start:11170 stop:11412 length:243 start_codon:yes stop_codon:yes gene_type:complete
MNDKEYQKILSEFKEGDLVKHFVTDELLIVTGIERPNTLFPQVWVRAITNYHFNGKVLLDPRTIDLVVTDNEAKTEVPEG